MSELDVVCSPASEAEVMAVLNRLFSHYPRPDVSQNAATLTMDDWLDDLSDVPLDVLMAAARDYRQSEAKYRPTPGQLLARVRPLMGPRTKARYVCGKLIGHFATPSQQAA